MIFEHITGVLKPDDINNGLFTLSKPFLQVIGSMKDMAMSDICFFAKPEVISAIMKNLPKVRDRLKPDMMLESAPEYEFIKIVHESGFKPYMLDFKYEKDWEILRDIPPQKLRKRLLRMRIFNRGLILLHLFPHLRWRICQIKFTLLGFTALDFSIGEHN
jgi:hypothetical protein